jgi:capsular exopolysaccharide synthesis family protein
MSHIYEALQRAEAERTSAAHEDDVRVDPESLSMAHPATAVLLESAVEESHNSSISRVSPTFLSDIPRRPWKPSFERLPSLQKGGDAVEQFRSLRSRIHEFRDLKKLKSLLVSSGLPKEGKSFIAANLAVNLARHKSSKVLLIDGDMRSPSLHRTLGCESSPGLSDYLAGKVSILEVMQSSEAPTDQDPMIAAVFNNLAFIPGGEGGDRAADLSGNKRFDELLTTVAPYFDWIVVDSSPVLSVSDAVNLARACDAVLLVARAGVTTFPVAQRAQHELKSSNIIGFVLNAVDKPPILGNYYGYGGNKE